MYVCNVYLFCVLATQEVELNGKDLAADRRLEKLRRDLGPVFMGALNDPETTEILLNADGTLWQEKLGGHMQPIGRMNAARAEAVMRTIASCLHAVITWDQPTIEGELPLDGSRFAGQLPPIVSAPTFAVRKKASSVFTLAQYVEQGIMTPEQKDIDAYLGGRDMITGVIPLIGNKFLQVVTIEGFPDASSPGILSALTELSIEYRWTTRFIFLERQDTLNLLNAFRKKWRRANAPWCLRRCIVSVQPELLVSARWTKNASASCHASSPCSRWL
jgi:hypothetical protein